VPGARKMQSLNLDSNPRARFSTRIGHSWIGDLNPGHGIIVIVGDAPGLAFWGP